MKTQGYYRSYIGSLFKELFYFIPNFIQSARQVALSNLSTKYSKNPSPELEAKIKALEKECSDMHRKCYIGRDLE